MEPDLRFARPSASSFERLAKCPASWRLSRDAIAQGLAPSAGEDANSGTRIHKALETDAEPEWALLSPDEQDTGRRCRTQIEEIVEAWAEKDGHGNLLPFTVQNERRLYMANNGIISDSWSGDDGRGLMCSGQSDWLYVQGERGLIIDTKTGRGDYEEAAGNLQLMGLATLSAGRWNLKSVRVAIVQPLAGAPTVADYDERALDAASRWVKNIVQLADGVPENGSPQVNPGAWCRYCDARLTCPALKERVSLTPLVAHGLQSVMPIASAQTVAQALDTLPLMKGYIEAVESVARARLERGESIPGWGLKERKGKREVRDIMDAYRTLPLTPAEFIGCCTVSLPKLEDELCKTEAAHLKKKDVRAYLEKNLGGNLTQKSSIVLSKTGNQIEP